jgi:hypothetical protein
MGFDETRLAHLQKRYTRAILSVSNGDIIAHNIAGARMLFAGKVIVCKIVLVDGVYNFMIKGVKPYYKALPSTRLLDDLHNYFGLYMNNIRFTWL